MTCSRMPRRGLPYPIMEDAFSEFQSGRLSLCNWGTACTYPSPEIALA